MYLSSIFIISWLCVTDFRRHRFHTDPELHRFGGREWVDTNTSVCSSSWHNPKPINPPGGLSPITLSRSWDCTDSDPPPGSTRLPNVQPTRLYLEEPRPGVDDVSGPCGWPGTVRSAPLSCVVLVWALDSLGLPWLRNKRSGLEDLEVEDPQLKHSCTRQNPGYLGCSRALPQCHRT